MLPSGLTEEAHPKIPSGSIAWKQGALTVGGELQPVWKYIPPPWSVSKPITLLRPPEDAVNTGMRTPRETIQMIGKPEAKVPKSISIDLGIADIYVSNHGKNIRFEGKGLETDVGKRIAGPAKGMDIQEEIVSTEVRRYEARELGIEEERAPLKGRRNGRLVPRDTSPEILEIFR